MISAMEFLILKLHAKNRVYKVDHKRCKVKCIPTTKSVNHEFISSLTNLKNIQYSKKYLNAAFEK